MPMTDRKLASLAKQHETLRLQAAEIKTQMAELSQKIIDEMDHRGTRQLDTNGAKITVAQNETVKYNWSSLVRRLGRERAAKIQKQDVDKDLLAREVQAGRIDPVRVAQCSEISVSAPYIRVTVSG